MPDWYTVIHHRHNNNTGERSIIAVEHFDSLPRARIRASSISYKCPHNPPPAWRHDTASIEPGRLTLAAASRITVATEAWVNGKMTFSDMPKPTGAR